MVTATFLSTLFYLFVARCRSCSDSSLGAVAPSDGGGKLLHGVDPSIANDRDERQAPALEIVRRLQSFLSGSLGHFHDPRRLTGLSLHNEHCCRRFRHPACPGGKKWQTAACVCSLLNIGTANQCLVPGQSGFARTCGADRAPAKTELGALLGLVHEFPERCSAKYLVTMSRILFRHCEERSDEAIQLISSLRGAKRRSNPACPIPAWLFEAGLLRCARNDSGRRIRGHPQHCEERSDE